VTTIAGFGVLALSPMPLVRNFGIITAATILYALLVAIFILPILLMFTGKLKGSNFGGFVDDKPISEPSSPSPPPSRQRRETRESSDRETKTGD